MDRQIVLEKLESLRRYLNRIEDKRPDKLERLLSDVDIQDIIALNFPRPQETGSDQAAIVQRFAPN